MGSHVVVGLALVLAAANGQGHPQRPADSPDPAAAPAVAAPREKRTQLFERRTPYENLVFGAAARQLDQAIQAVRPALALQQRIVCGTIVIQVDPRIDERMIVRAPKTEGMKIRRIEPPGCNE